MKFVADEGIDKEIVKSLRFTGHDVYYIAESAPGSTDEKVLHSANKDDRILITRDTDFGDLVFRDRMVHSGIILNRLHSLTSEEKAQIVVGVIRRFGEDLLGAFTVIQPDKVRIRRLP